MPEQEKKGFMYKLASGIVKARWVILAVFLGVAVLAIFSIGWVKVEDDITVYLSDSAEAKQGVDLMSREFKTFLTAQYMVEDVDEDEAERIAKRLREMDGVYRVEHDGSEDFYKDRCALYNVTFNGEDGDPVCDEAMERINKYLRRYDVSFYTDSYDVGNEILVQEMGVVLIIVIIVVISVLIFTSSTYGEILVLVSTFLMAAITHMATNFLLGTISLVSNTVTLVMQLALSVDYAIIYCNRYKEEHAKLPVKEAVIVALSKSVPEISASSLTTIAGLAAMTFMEFKLGVDMGIVLMKSIVFSLLSVFLFMPAMLVFCGKLMDKTRHKNFVPKVDFMGEFAYATRFIIPPIFVALVIVGLIGYGRSNYGYSVADSRGIHLNELDISLDKIQAKFGKNNFIAVLVPAADYETDLAFADELQACPEVNSVMSIASIEVMDGVRLADKVTYKEVMEIAEVDETLAKAIMAFSAAGNRDYREVTEDLEEYEVPIIDLFENLHSVVSTGEYELTPEQTAQIDDLYEQLSTARVQLESDNHHCFVTYIDLPVQSDETFEFLERIHSIADQYYDGKVLITGNAVAAKDFADSYATDSRVVSVLSIVLVMIILLFTFKSVGMPILLILVIQGSIWLNFAIPAFAGKQVFFMCFLIVSAIQMGANIDYAIVISSRYNELREAGMAQKDAITDTLNLAFPTVITSGLMMVAAGLMIGVRVSQGIVAGMGLYVGIGTAISLVLVNFALPQILIFGDGFARATSIRFTKKLLGPNAAMLLRRIAGAVLALVVLFTVVLVPVGLKRAQDNIRIAEEQTDDLLNRTLELRTIADELAEEEKVLDDTKLGFAEHLLTDQIGEEQLEEGRAQYEAGAAELEAYKQMLADGEEEYAESVKQYEEGLFAFESGQAMLAAAAKALEEGKKEYEAAKAQLAEGQALYDSSLAEYEAGKAKYDEGAAALAAAKQEYASAEALLSLTKGLYDMGINAYNEMKKAEAKLEALKADETASEWDLYWAQAAYDLARANYEDSLIGQPWEKTVKDYEDAQRQLADAQQQINDAQRQLDEGKAELEAAEALLAEGKAELDDGYAQLAEAEKQIKDGEAAYRAGQAELKDAEKQLEDAKKQLEAGRKELDDGKKQIDDGEKQLDDAGKQIDEGVEMLNENRKNLEDDLAALDAITDKQEKLDAGMQALRNVKEINDRVRYTDTPSEICSTAESYLNGQLSSLQKEGKLMKFVSILLIASAAAAAVGLILWLLLRFNIAAVLILLATLGSVVGALFWRMGCAKFGMLCFWLALALAVFCAIVSDILVRRIKELKKKELEA